MSFAQGSLDNTRRSALVVALMAAMACAHDAPPPTIEPPVPVAQPENHEPDVDVRVAEKWRRSLELERARLEADLRRAEQELVALESGRGGSHSRADIISELADARVQVDQARRVAPWRRTALERAERMLADAELHLSETRFHAASFLSSRSRRLAAALIQEARTLDGAKNARIVRGDRVNVRGGPSTAHAILEVLESKTPVFAESEQESWVLVRTTRGTIGWVHGSLLAPTGAALQ